MVGAHLFFTTGPGLAFSSRAVPEGGETGAVNMLMVVEGCAISGTVGDVMGTVNVVTVEGCAISGMEVCVVEAFAMVPLGVYSSPESELPDAGASSSSHLFQPSSGPYSH